MHACHWVRRLGDRLTSPRSLLTYLLLSTPLALGLGLLSGPWVLPLLEGTAAFPLFFFPLRRGEWRRTLALMLSWALLVALLVTALTLLWPQPMGGRVLLGESYRRQMFTWVASGVGAEGDIRLFLPQHLGHFLLFALLTGVSGGLLGLVMGSVLLNYMSYYVGSLVAQSGGSWQVTLLAWPPWAALRVAGFILLAASLSAWLYARTGLGVESPRETRRAALTGLACLGADVLLKWWLAPLWQIWLKRWSGL